MNIDNFRSFVLFIIKKSQSGGNPTPSQFNLAVERAYMEFIMRSYGNKEEYQPGRPIPRKAWQQSQKISDDLRFLLTRRRLSVPLTGELIIPDGAGSQVDLDGKAVPGYLHHSSLRFNFSKSVGGEIQSKEVPIDILTDAELGSALSSSIVNPTKRYPACAYYDKFIQFEPKDLQTVIFTYLRLPVVPVWAFTTTNGRPVYDPANSVDLEAPEQVINEIAFNTLSFMGLSIREQAIYQASEQYVQRGV